MEHPEIENRNISYGIILRMPLSGMEELLDFIKKHDNWTIAHDKWSTERIYISKSGDVKDEYK